MRNKGVGTYRPSCAVITAADPDGEAFDFHVEEDGMLEIRSEAPNYESFEVEVYSPDSDPSDPPYLGPVTGRRTQPVVIKIPRGAANDEPYTVSVTHHHHKLSGESSPTQEIPCSIHPCPGCTLPCKE
jgi:hypothetical protein